MINILKLNYDVFSQIYVFVNLTIVPTSETIFDVVININGSCLTQTDKLMEN